MSEEQKFTYPNFPEDLEFQEPHFTRYKKFIESRPIRQYEKGITKKHHKIPKSLGGSEDKDNLIYLTGREHYIAHLILWKTFGGKMAQAFWYMTNRKVYKILISSRQYENLKSSLYHTLESRQKMSNALKGRVGTFTGCLHSKEAKEKMSSRKKDKTWGEIRGSDGARVGKEKASKRMQEIWDNRTDEEKVIIARKISENRVFIPTEDTKKRMSEAAKGKILSNETKRKISEASQTMWDNRTEDERKDIAMIISKKLKGNTNAKGAVRTDETKNKTSNTVKNQWANMSDEKRKEMSEKMSKAAKKRWKKT